MKATERSQSSTRSLRGRGWMHMIICPYSLHEWEGSITASTPYGLRHTTHFLSFNHDLSLIFHMDFLIRPYAWILAPRFPPFAALDVLLTRAFFSFGHVIWHWRSFYVTPSVTAPTLECPLPFFPVLPLIITGQLIHVNFFFNTSITIKF